MVRFLRLLLATLFCSCVCHGSIVTGLEFAEAHIGDSVIWALAQNERGPITSWFDVLFKVQTVDALPNGASSGDGLIA